MEFNGYPVFGNAIPVGVEIKRPSGEMKLKGNLRNEN
jgi:hypothetical protein